ncbi:fungal-specific transcription factor domain-containing protein [Xylariales sp. PMI_506]|nr:fungal-specific transcription factor domain-containing protein [Xylariales sp. PMI_506]
MGSEPCHPTACKNCRRRGRKCDRTLPSCLSCQRRGTTCEGYITRWPGVAARGRLAGKTVPVLGKSSSSQPQGSPGSVQRRSGNPSQNKSLPDTLNSRRTEQISHSINDIIGHSDPSPTPISDTSSAIVNFSHLLNIASIAAESDDIDILVDYYKRELRNVSYTGDEPDGSPYTRYIIPILDAIPPLRYAVAASAACHLGARVGQRELELKSLSLRLSATELLGQRLHDTSLCSNSDTLATMLMLAQLDVCTSMHLSLHQVWTKKFETQMCSGDCVEFETHLAAAATILRTNNHEFPGRDYFEQRLIWLDTMGATSSSRIPQFSSNEVRTVLNRSKDLHNGEWSCDMFYCPIDIFEHLRDATMLYKIQLQDSKPTQQVLKRAETLVKSLSHWEVPKKKSKCPREVMETWRLGVILYMASLFPTVGLPYEMSTLASNLFHNVQAIPIENSWRRALIWPLFQASLNLGDDDRDDKGFVTSELNNMLARTGCRSNSVALEKLELAWSDHPIRYNSISLGIHGQRLMLG